MRDLPRPAVFLTVLLGACAGSSVEFMPTRKLAVQPAARPAESVEIFSAGPPTQPYVELGIVEGRQNSALSEHHTAEILASMRKTAGQHGCDALVVTGAANRTKYDLEARTLEGLRGTCIVWSASTDSQIGARAP